ncbi:hypothetical protein ABE484_20035, partial [Pseudomonas pudica]|uniref:hypothetical protein n=1 Tax=Pseudomonas pudica TaxID=272772 RepID=UPI00320ADD4A
LRHLIQILYCFFFGLGGGGRAREEASTVPRIFTRNQCQSEENPPTATIRHCPKPPQWAKMAAFFVTPPIQAPQEISDAQPS